MVDLNFFEGVTWYAGNECCFRVREMRLWSMSALGGRKIYRYVLMSNQFVYIVLDVHGRLCENLWKIKFLVGHCIFYVCW